MLRPKKPINDTKLSLQSDLDPQEAVALQMAKGRTITAKILGESLGITTQKASPVLKRLVGKERLEKILNTKPVEYRFSLAEPEEIWPIEETPGAGQQVLLTDFRQLQNTLRTMVKRLERVESKLSSVWKRLENIEENNRPKAVRERISDRFNVNLTIKRLAKRIATANPSMGGLVSIPDLIEEVQDNHSGLTREEIKSEILQVCQDSSFQLKFSGVKLPGSKTGIRTPMGEATHLLVRE